MEGRLRGTPFEPSNLNMRCSGRPYPSAFVCYFPSEITFLTEFSGRMVLVPPGFQNFDLILISPILGCRYFFSVHLLKGLFFVGCCNHDSFSGTGSTGEFFSLQSFGRHSTFFPIHILVLQILASC